LSRWPNITVKKAAPADAAEWDTVSNKLETQFSEKPGG